ncbi:MAG: hypothetical protein WCW16_05180 [Candidatus Magasanikbacteria bacterium]
MLLSRLQEYILLELSQKGGRVDRKIFRTFYETQNKKPKQEYLEHIITQSIERLIDRELLTGFGRRTPHKWFITHVGLTLVGAKIVKEIYQRRQRKLPFRR